MNKGGKTKGKPYTYNVIHPLWKEACERAGEEYIKPYSGTKHSTCTEFLNEKGLSESELMMVTGHKRLESLRQYTKTGIEPKRELLERRVVRIGEKTRKLN